MYKASDERHNRGVSSCGTPQSTGFHSILFYQQVTLHLGHAEVAANVVHLVSLLDSKGEVRSNKPRAISSG